MISWSLIQRPPDIYPYFELHGVNVNGLEDRLDEYLAQNGDEPDAALSLRRIAYLDQQLARAGIVPTGRLELPANPTAELLNTLLAQGESVMPNTISTAPTRVRIHSHVTQSRFLHVEDALNIGKLRLWGGNYRRGQGTDSSAFHFLDLADARVIFTALAGGEANFSYKEYKGTPPQKDQPAVSRVMSVAAKGENVYIELKTGPGKLTNTGAITPNGPAVVEVNVAFKLYEARRLAASVLAYLLAWDVLRMMVNQSRQAGISQPVPYLLSPASTDNSDNREEANPIQAADPASVEAARPVPTPRPPHQVVMRRNGDRPVTRKGTAPTVVKPSIDAARQPNDPGKTGNTPIQALDGPGVTTTSPQLAYGDGNHVDLANVAEVQTFQRYVADKKTAPQSRPALQTYYRQLTAA
jgi:hypothetical protein